MILTGKPSLHALRFVARRLGLRRRDVGIVGDDPSVEIIMARRGGAKAFAVTTGVTAREGGSVRPDCGPRTGAAAPRRSAGKRAGTAVRPSRRCDAVTTIREGDLLWTPSKDRRDRSQVLRFMQWLKEHRGLRLESYDALWHWSVTDLESFWHSIWDYFGIQASAPFERVLGRRSMPGAEWFTGARLNYAGHILARERPRRRPSSPSARASRCGG